MPGIAAALVLVACDSTGSDSASSDDAPPLIGPDLIVAPVPDQGPVIVPCDAVRSVRVENRGDEIHQVDTIVFSTESTTLFLQSVIDLPRIVRPGSSFDIEVLATAAEVGASDAEFVITSDEGTISTGLHVDVTYAESRAESFVVTLPQVDVLLVIDHSGNMAADHQSKIERGIPPLLEALSAAADWQLILVTDDDGCSNGPVFSNADADADWLVEHAFDNDPEESELTEALLELASVSLAQNSPTECNAPFLRAGSQLQVIAVSDEPEQSGRAWSFWLADFEVYADVVTVSAIVDQNGECGAGGDGYLDAADATGGRVLDICEGGWGNDMDELADAIQVLPPTFVLAADAMPGSIVAEVDGNPVNHTYDAETRAVTLANVLPEGTAVDIAYGVPGICPPAP